MKKTYTFFFYFRIFMNNNSFSVIFFFLTIINKIFLIAKKEKSIKLNKIYNYNKNIDISFYWLLIKKLDFNLLGKFILYWIKNQSRFYIKRKVIFFILIQYISI